MHIGIKILGALIVAGIVFHVLKKFSAQDSLHENKEEPVFHPQPSDTKVRGLAKQLAKLDQKLEWLEQLDGYSKVLHSLLNPLQVLLGCVDTLKVSGLSDSQRTYFLTEEALEPLALAAKKFRLLPKIEKPAVLKEEDWKKYLPLTADELQAEIREQTRRVHVKSYLQRDWELLQGFERIGLFGLSETPLEQLKDEDLRAVGENAAALLREKSIFPLYKDAKELANLPALQQSFNEGSSGMTACPGLFLFRDGKYELFGSHNGIWVKNV